MEELGQGNGPIGETFVRKSKTEMGGWSGNIGTEEEGVLD